MSGNVEWTSLAEKSLEDSFNLAKERSHGMLSPLHLAVALIADPNSMFARVASKLGAVPASVHRQLAEKMAMLPQQTPAPPKPAPTQEFQRVLNKAEQLRNKFGDALIAVDHLILSLHESNDCAKILDSQGMSNKQLERIIEEMRGGKKITNKFQEANYESLSKYATDMCKLAEEGKLDPVIGRDTEVRRITQIICRKTKNNPVLVGEPGVGKSAIVEGLAQRIVRGDVPETLQNLRIYSLDVGALVAGAKYRGEFEERLKAVLNEVKENQDKIILFIDEMHLILKTGGEGQMDAANMLKPMLARGELRTIGATTLDEYRKYVEKDAAFERRFQPITVNEPSVIDCISILRGIKERYEVHHRVNIADSAIVAAATLADRYITGRFMPDKAIDLLDEACANVRVNLDSRPEAIDILERKKMQLEIEQKALEREKKDSKKSAERLRDVNANIQKINEELIPLVERYESEKSQMNHLTDLQAKVEEKKNKLQRAERERDMEKAADLRYNVIPILEESIRVEKEKVERQKKENQMLQNQVNEMNIADVVQRWTGIPVSKLTQTDRDRLLNLADVLHRTVKGQDEAVAKVAEAILRTRAGMARERRPPSFLMIGPTGVGKTELARTLAKELFDDTKFLVRIDCSELMEQHSVSKLIGAPPGYIGHEDGGQLTEPIRRRPYQVVLFDEVEKAHPQVLNILLQLLDDGHLTDNHGHHVDFSNTVVMLTSNLGSQHLLSTQENMSPTAKEAVNNRVMQEVRKFFRPELLNRLDDIVMFTKLGFGELSEIVGQCIADINNRLKDRSIVCTATKAANDYILEQGYDPDYGARPLKRWVEKSIVTELSRMIISGTLPDGSEVHIDVNTQRSKLTFTVRRGRSQNIGGGAPESPQTPPH